MSTPLQPDQIYRVFTSYEALKEGLEDRVEDLNVPMTEVDAAGGMTRGNMQKCLSKSEAPWARDFGWKTLEAALKGTGLVLALIVDDERFAPIKAQMAARKLAHRPIARNLKPKWLFTPKNAHQMGTRRWDGVPEDVRKKHMKKLSRKAAKARRAGARKSVGATA